MTRARATLRGRWWQAFFQSFRHCHRCGQPLTRRYVREEKCRRHVCGSCGHITYLNPKVVAGLIPVLPDGRIALIRRGIEPALGRWSYPAGFQELGESVEEAAARETLEEAALRVRVTGLVGVYSYPDAGVVTVVFEGRSRARRLASSGHETSEIAAFEPTAIPWRSLAFRSSVEALKDWIAGGPMRRTPRRGL